MAKKGKKREKLAKKSGIAAPGKPEVEVRAYGSHVLVCKGGDCKKRGSKGVRKAIKSEARAEGINREVRMDSVDCLGLCKHGPNVVVYGPNGHGGTWYLGLDEGDAPEVVRRHLKGGEPVRELAAGFRPPKKR